MIHLENLAIARTTLTDNAMRNLGKVTSLVRLKIAKNSNITDEGVACLANLKNLEELNLKETGVTKKCLPSLQKMTRLKTVELSLSPEQLAQIQLTLRKTDPACQVQGKRPPNPQEEIFK